MNCRRHKQSLLSALSGPLFSTTPGRRLRLVMEVRRRRRMPTRTNNREAHIMFKRLPPTSTSHGLQQLIHSFSLQCSSPNCFVNDSTRTGYKRHDLLYTRPRLTRNNACPEWREPCRTMSMIDASMMLIGLQRETLALTLFGMYNRKVSQPVSSTPHLFKGHFLTAL